MLNLLIRWSLRNRAIIIGLAIILLAAGFKTGRELPVEVLPDLTKPTVTILIEAPGLAPEEVETLVTQPVESSLMGIAGLNRLRSTSDIALSLVFAEFDWGTDIYKARQFVQERLQSARESLPEGTEPYLTPVASIMGEVLLIGVRSPDGSTAPMDVRTIADWNIRMRLQSISGVAEVLNMGGGVKQAQVQPDPFRMQANGVSIEELEQAVREAATNSTGGFIDTGSQEIMVRNLAMTIQLEDISKTVVKLVNGRPISIGDVAKVAWDTEPKRGDSSVNGTPGVIMSIVKAPGFDTVDLTEKIEAAIEELQPSFPEGVEATILFRQRDFIDRSINNLMEAIRDGAVMVVIILFLFLLNFRTTFITLMAMPLSFAITLLTFKWFGMSVNSMTLGGLAVAIGMVVDDAIVDVENVFRRLKENANLANPLPKLEVIAQASGEVRNSILYATVLIVLVFVPLLGLAGVEGRLFAPIAIATIVSMIASFVVSLTAIPVLCSLLLRERPKGPAHHADGALVRGMKKLLSATLLRVSLRHPTIVIALVAILFAFALTLYPKMSKDFLPAFHEETVIVTTAAAPGTSLAEMEHLAKAVENQIRQVPEVNHIGRRIGRAERSDHVVPISNAEFDIDFKKDVSDRSTKEVLEDIRKRIKTVPGTFSILSGPLSHRISHLLSGVTAPVAVKVFGQDMTAITEIGTKIQAIAKTIPGLEDAKLDQQAPIPQLRIELDRERALAHGVTPGELNSELSMLLGGASISQLRENQRTIDLAIRLPLEWRNDPEKIRELPVHTKTGRNIPLKLVADVREASGPSSVMRENTQRRYIVSITPTQRNAGELVRQLQEKVAAEIKLPEGTFISYEGEFQAEKAASERIAVLFTVILVVIVMLLWSYFKSLMLAIQVLLNLPLALMGSLWLTWILVGNISIATLVGFIAVGGVAARNGIMMISHYLHLMKHEGEGFTDRMIQRGTLERFVPVTMTALSAGIALIPFVISMGEPGKEILSPVAICIVGGLITSTFLDFAVTPAVFRLFGKKAAERALALHAPATH
ncbi:efflux RND transporter permease subunit [Luteolibacter sp. GHJ8]|uniref:Efflux RND transporter permease subunit n=1 Tax=Luteolibacter rhizosphaerae TaxID=2989719 RepID=A0ABT3G614_9BACT|nr:efflux RND transporter permease subunit [Luteolibacter rhizosphaerae]MCW1915024.1 efflux RND transporter permease subunit [Luteolibacter rhizosphaerae]